VAATGRHLKLNTYDKIGKLVWAAVTTGQVVGMQRTRPVYEVLFEGRRYKVAVSIGDNGFIVGANPVGAQ
jgi:hypothetical protein